jgi:hypothetical protein
MTSQERKIFEREKHYGNFQNHKYSVKQSPNMIGLAKFHSTTVEEVFNGIFYNLDAQVEN